ncbi:MAG: hypothetical protein JWO28_2028 [Hyphomicrobiales bacterium]|jgi:hypothetical protein|nr:hypothetical protein [Hyphomicrobiales bacterium]
MNKRIVLKSMLALATLATTAASARPRSQAEPDLPAEDAQEAQARYSSRYFFIRPRRRLFLFRKRRGPPLPARPTPTVKPVMPVTP